MLRYLVFAFSGKYHGAAVFGTIDNH